MIPEHKAYLRELNALDRINSECFGDAKGPAEDKLSKAVKDWLHARHDLNTALGNRPPQLPKEAPYDQP